MHSVYLLHFKVLTHAQLEKLSKIITSTPPSPGKKSGEEGKRKKRKYYMSEIGIRERRGGNNGTEQSLGEKPQQ